MRRIEIDMEEVKLVPKAQRKYDDAEMAALLKRIADEFEEINKEMENRFINRTRDVPAPMRDPQATVDTIRQRESIFQNPEYIRRWKRLEQAFGIETGEDCERLGFKYEHFEPRYSRSFE